MILLSHSTSTHTSYVYHKPALDTKCFQISIYPTIFVHADTESNRPTGGAAVHVIVRDNLIFKISHKQQKLHKFKTLWIKFSGTSGSPCTIDVISSHPASTGNDITVM